MRTLLFAFPILCCAQAPPSGDSAILPAGARLEQIFSGGVLTEGVTSAPDGTIYFSDITFTGKSAMQAGHIMKFDPRTKAISTFRSPSGMSNGLKFDAQGRLLAAEGADYGGRRITRTDMATGKAEILAGMFEGRPLNSPNDITVDERGRVYFSDPRYLGWETIDQPVMAVYRIDPDRTVHRIITDAGKPNGVCLSPDQRTLYVVSNDNGSTGLDRIPETEPMHRGRMALLAYDLAPDGSAKFRRQLVNYAPEDGPDGLTVDVEGNIYAAVRAASRPGIVVYSPEGKERAYIPTANLPTNVGWGRGADSNLLYITEGGNVHRIRVNKNGYQLPTQPKPPMVRAGATVKLSEHVWAIPDDHVGGVPNVGIVVGSNAALVIDTGLGPRNAQTILREVDSIARRPELYLVTTHFHPEHAGGGSAFPANTKFVLARVQQQDLDELGQGMMDTFSRMSPLHAELLKDVRFRKADVLFDREYTIHLGGVDVDLLALGPTHTRGDTMAYVRQDRVLFAGDIVMNHAFMAFGKQSSMQTWLGVLDRIDQLKVDKLVPSHGSIGDASLVGQQRAVLTAVQARARELKAQGKSADEAGKTIAAELQAKYPDWTAPPRIGQAVRSAFDEAK